jgi:hypothetical protein
MPTSSQQVYLINGILVDFFGNPVYLPSSEGPTGPQGATGINGLPGITGPTGSTAATSKFIKEWISAGNQRLIIEAAEISLYTPGFLIGRRMAPSLADVQIQLWRVNSAFIDPETEENTSIFWELIRPTDYIVNINGDTGAIYIDLTYRLVNSTRTRAVVIC